MKRLPALAALLVMAFLLAACGGGQAGQAPDPGEEPTEPATEESAPKTSQEATGEVAPAESTAPEGERDGPNGDSGGYSVTTLDGEEVSLGGGGEVTALFFMAGW